MKITIRIVKTGDRQFKASCPSLPGCTACAESTSEAVSRMHTAIRHYLASMNAPAGREATLDERLVLSGAAERH